MGFDSGRSEQIIREAVLRQGILVHNCEGIEIVINERKKRMYLREYPKVCVNLQTDVR